MTWTYSGDPGSSDKDYVRFLIGDVDSERQQVSDENILFLLTKWTTPIKAAWKAAEFRAAFYADRSDVAIGSLSIIYGQRYQQWIDLANRLKAIAKVQVLGTPVVNKEALGGKYLDSLGCQLCECGCGGEWRACLRWPSPL